MQLTDKFGRAITDLRISITDRCNYKCVYCRTGNEGAVYGELPFADYLRMARVLVSLGITKVRITGGEPLLRKGVVDFVRELANLRTIWRNARLSIIATTTNGHLLADMAQPLKDAGLKPRHGQYGRGRSRSLRNASRGCPADSIRCWPECGLRATRGCGR